MLYKKALSAENLWIKKTNKEMQVPEFNIKKESSQGQGSEG